MGLLRVGLCVTSQVIRPLYQSCLWEKQVSQMQGRWKLGQLYALGHLVALGKCEGEGDV